MLDQFSEIIYFSKGVIRNKWVISVVACVVCIGGWLSVYNMPDVYESSARVHVDTRTMLRPLLRGIAIQSDVRGMVLIMKKLMFTQGNMIKVAELAGMDIDLGSESSIRMVVNKLKNNVTIEGGRDEIFTIKYESADPLNAKDVVQSVLKVFSEQTQQSSLGDAKSAKRFIDTQIKEYEQRLRNAERAKENFTRENIGLLPGQAGDGQINQIQEIRKSIEDAELLLTELQSRKAVLNEQMSEADDSGDEWGLTDTLDDGSMEDERIVELERRKDEILLKYTENHPFIITIDNQIEAIQEKNAEEDTDSSTYEGMENPEVMANPYVQTIKISLNNIDTEVATIEARIKSYESKLKQQDEQFNSRLAIETQMQNLNRDYATIKKNYLSLIDRREQARMSSSVDTQVSALKFKVIDPAHVPSKPSAPLRPLLYSLILVAGFVLGIALALVMVFMRPTIIEAKQMRELTGLPVLGVVSEVVNETQAKQNRNRLMRYVFVNVLLLLGYSGIMLSGVYF